MKISWYWLPLFVVGLIAVLSPQIITAQVDKIDLTLRLVPDSFYSNLAPGKEKTIYLEVSNTGDKAITNIRLSADKPEGWTVEFRPALIGSLSPRTVKTVDIIIKSASNAATGDYNITLFAEANETRRVTSVFVRVETKSFFWVWIGAGVAALVIAAAIFIFMRFGRQ